MKKKRRRIFIITTMRKIQTLLILVLMILTMILVMTLLMMILVMTQMLIIMMTLIMMMLILGEEQASLLFTLKHGKKKSYNSLIFYKGFISVFAHNSDGLATKIKKTSIARWFTGCYINYEDKCFDDKLFGELTPPETFEENHLRCFPVNTNFRKKEPLKTNGASAKLGFTVLLDPMLHDQINGKAQRLERAHHH